jgi:hypothetical protein
MLLFIFWLPFPAIALLTSQFFSQNLLICVLTKSETKYSIMSAARSLIQPCQSTIPCERSVAKSETSETQRCEKLLMPSS